MAVVISLSGGLDSATLLSYYVSHKQSVLCVNFYYNSKHGLREGLAAEKLCQYHNVDLIKLNVENLFERQHLTSALMKRGSSLPEGHYNDATMSQTIVPGRNTIFASILAGIAESLHFSDVALAIHHGDHHIYPDCRPEWAIAMDNVIQKSTEGRVELTAPFLYQTKQEIVATGLKLKTPYELSYTCYRGEAKACGRCGSCVERLEAFKLNNAKDPIAYE